MQKVDAHKTDAQKQMHKYAKDAKMQNVQNRLNVQQKMQKIQKVLKCKKNAKEMLNRYMAYAKQMHNRY